MCIFMVQMYGLLQVYICDTRENNTLMNAEYERRAGVFQRAREIILKDETIPLEEKEGILKLIRVLVEASESSSGRRPTGIMPPR